MSSKFVLTSFIPGHILLWVAFLHSLVCTLNLTLCGLCWEVTSYFLRHCGSGDQLRYLNWQIPGLTLGPAKNLKLQLTLSTTDFHGTDHMLYSRHAFLLFFWVCTQDLRILLGSGSGLCFSSQLGAQRCPHARSAQAHLERTLEKKQNRVTLIYTQSWTL